MKTAVLWILLLCSVTQGQTITATDTVGHILPALYDSACSPHAIKSDTLDVTQVVVVKHCKTINVPCPDARPVFSGMYYSCSALHWKDTCWYEVVEKVDTMPIGIGKIDLGEFNRFFDSILADPAWRICDTIGRSIVDSTYPYYRSPNLFDPNELTNTEIATLREIIKAWRKKDLIRYSDTIRFEVR